MVDPEDDLIKIFSSENYTEGKHRQSYGFWTPLIALYSRCREEEICQLHFEVIQQERSVWVFDINDKKEKRLKSQSSERLVPVHLKLVKICLLELVKSLQDKGEERLFPALHQRRDGFGQTASKWYGRFKNRCGSGAGITFRPFRHTFITPEADQVDTYMIHELDGHTIDSETMGRYGERFSPQILLREGIEKIDYEIDLSGIRMLDS